jgi:RND family efflux transporter MFP subunit
MVDARMELDRRKSQMADAQKEFQKAQSNYRMNRELYRQHAIPKKDLMDAEQALDKAQGAVSAAMRDYDGQEKKVNQSEVVSPISGIVLSDKVGSNGWVGSGQELFIIGQLDRFRVRTKVDELDISKIQPGQAAEIQLEAFPGTVFPGSVESLGAQAQQGAFAEIDVMVGITDLKGMAVKPNLSAKVSFQAKVIPGAITIPANCVQYEGNTNFVNVLTPAGTMIKRTVEIGGSSDGRVVILDGLGAGEAVLVPESNAAA